MGRRKSRVSKDLADGLLQLVDVPGSSGPLADRDASAYARFVEDLANHGGRAGQVREVCQDMTEAYVLGALRHLPCAEITFDRYHVKAQLTTAVDEVRKAERREHGDLLRHSRYLWLRNPRNLTDNQADRVAELMRHPLKTVRAYRWMLRFDAVYELEDPEQAASYPRAFTRGAATAACSRSSASRR